jgi:transposase
MSVAKDDFIFNDADNTYRCPAGETLTYRFDSMEHDLKLHGYGIPE